jgi:hypothetical protein
VVTTRASTGPLDLPSVTTDPNETNWSRSPTRTYAVVPITPMVPVPSVPMIVIMIAPMILSAAFIMIAPMILVVIVAFRVALILLVLVMLTLLVLATVIIAFSSESRCGKHKSTCYRANEGEFANHLVFLCYWC